MQKIMMIVAGAVLCSFLSGCLYCRWPCTPAYPGPAPIDKARGDEPYSYYSATNAADKASFPDNPGDNGNYDWKYWQRGGMVYDNDWGYYHNYSH